jgi:Kef-type K+ transport system membrane component KefB
VFALEHSADAITRLVLQLAVILSAAKFGGEISERYFKTPAVVGELAAGIMIGPFALGGMDIPWLGPLFEQAGRGVVEAEGFVIPVSESLWSMAQVGAIILLFNAGLETNLRQFLRYAGSASLVAIGGAALPFALGAAATVAFGFADSFTDPTALFIGAIFMATSIGISVRILADLRRLDTAEGVTILAAAVLDDVLGILVLTIVVGIAVEGEFSVASIGLVTLKTLGFWVALTGIGILLSKRISNLLDKFQVSGGALALAVALAFFSASLAETFGLAMIIGAFSIGLALSGTELSHRLDEPLRGVVAVFIPIFFVVMGTLVDVTALGGVWMFGIAFTAVAVLAKIVGSAVPALLTGFNRLGALRIGAGMLPRGEVTLIMVGIGISNGIIERDLFGISVIMIIVSTVLAPLILSRSFKTGASGTRSTSTTKVKV